MTRRPGDKGNAVPAPRRHGGDGAQVAAALGLGDVLDLSMTLNPFAPDVATRIADHLEAIGRYPDPAAAERALADAIEVDARRVVLTAGGAGAIAAVRQHIGGGVLAEPEFGLHPRNPTGPRWRSDPHSPSGRLAGPDDRVDVRDEAFYGLATGRWTRGDPCWVVGSLTKVFACPGVRIGYVLVPPGADDEPVRELVGPWPIEGPLAEALPTILAAADLPTWSRKIADARADLVALLCTHDFEPDPSDAPWVLVRAPGLRERLAPHGVVVRDCSSFGLPEHVRIAVPGAAGLERLATALNARRSPTPASDATRLQARPPARGAGSTIPDGLVWQGLRGGMLVAGTTSDAGKSWLVTGLCRLLARNGVRVAPFKGQNMALNAAVTAAGAEIGHAQWVQALAAGVEAEAVMNPVLLKPTGERTSQVIVLGEAIGEYPAGDYHRSKQELRPVVLGALADLRSRFDVVLCEGAGGAAEINLLDGDLANLPLAHAADLPAVVVGDIDRGGVFASLYGTVALLPDHLRQHVRGFVINRLSGDPALLDDACADLHRRCGVPTLGVVPMLPGTDIDAEDSLGLDRWNDVSNGTPADLDVAVIRLPHLSNAGDLDPLRVEPGVAVRLVSSPHKLGRPDLIVLPGSKTTVADLQWLRSTGLAAAIERSEAAVLGICAGAQMLGARLDDPDAVESGHRSVAGLGLLDLTTTFRRGKMLDRPRGAVLAGIGAGTPVAGYRIHNGRVNGIADQWIAAEGGEALGWHAGRVLATTLHGLLESDAFRRALLDGLLARSGRVRGQQHAAVPFAAIRTARFDAIADALEQHLDLPALLRLIESA